MTRAVASRALAAESRENIGPFSAIQPVMRHALRRSYSWSERPVSQRASLQPVHLAHDRVVEALHRIREPSAATDHGAITARLERWGARSPRASRRRT